MNKAKHVLETFNNNKKSFTNYIYWNLLEIVENVYQKLLFSQNLPKYLRSAIHKGQFKLTKEKVIALKDKQSLESLTRQALNSQDSNNDWIDLAIYNNLKEKQYTSEGGTILKATFPIVNGDYKLNSVLGSSSENLSEEEFAKKQLYGLDINQKLTFINNDLEVLSPIKTMEQSIINLFNLKQGDNPEIPNLGINRSLHVGTNIQTFSFPILFRELTDIFATDDTVTELELTDILYKNDGIFATFNISTSFGEIKKTQINLNNL